MVDLGFDGCPRDNNSQTLTKPIYGLALASTQGRPQDNNNPAGRCVTYGIGANGMPSPQLEEQTTFSGCENDTAARQEGTVCRQFSGIPAPGGVLQQATEARTIFSFLSENGKNLVIPISGRPCGSFNLPSPR